MAKSSFGNWQLSSSESEDEEPTQGVLLKVKSNSKSLDKRESDDSDTSAEEYVPLSMRLKMKGSNSTEDDDLPIFDVLKNTSVVPISNEEKIISTLKTNVMHDRTNKISPGKRKFNDEVLDLTEDDDVISKPISGSIKRKPPQSPRKNVDTEKVRLAKKAEAERRKALNSHVKALKPEECLKYMEVLISQLIVSMFEDFEFMKELKEDFEPMCQRELFCIPCVRWRRKVTMVSEVIGQTTEIHDEPEMLVVLPASEFVKLVHAQIAESLHEETLTVWVKKLQVENPGINIHLVCHGLEKYNKNLKNKQRREEKRIERGETAGRRRKPPSVPEVSQDEIEEALVDLQVECKTTVLYIERPVELVTMIKQLTKSIGEAPYKRMKRNDVLFINEIPSVKLNVKTGEGLKKVWKQMIQQFHNVTPVMATAITNRYPSLLSLIRAYESCGNDTSKAEALLADIAVRRGVGTLQTNRRIGAELSYKIYRLLMSRISTERLY